MLQSVMSADTVGVAEGSVAAVGKLTEVSDPIIFPDGPNRGESTILTGAHPKGIDVC